VYKSNSSPDSLPTSFLDEAYERAWQRLVTAAQEAAAEPTLIDHAAGSYASAAEPLLAGAELGRVLRKPLAWLFALAQGIAVQDPVDLAAVQHVGAATYARLSGRRVGFRASDLLNVFALLLGAFDPTLAFSALSVTLGDDVAAAVLGSELPMSVYVTTIPRPRISGHSSTVCPHPQCPMNA
jgi:hypothetical protein